MARYPKSKFGFALTSISKKGLLTALNSTTALGMLVFMISAMYAGGPVAAKRLQNSSFAKVVRNYDQAAQQSITSPAQLSKAGRSGRRDDKREDVLFNHRRAMYSGLLNLVAPAVTASKTDALFTDIDGDLQADPGDILKYTVA